MKTESWQTSESLQNPGSTHRVLNNIPVAHFSCIISCAFQTFVEIPCHYFANLNGDVNLLMCKFSLQCDLLRNKACVCVMLETHLGLINEHQACRRELHQHQNEDHQEKLSTQIIALLLTSKLNNVRATRPGVLKAKTFCITAHNRNCVKWHQRHLALWSRKTLNVYWTQTRVKYYRSTFT